MVIRTKDCFHGAWTEHQMLTITKGSLYCSSTICTEIQESGGAQSGNKTLSFLFLENLMKFYNASYMKIA